MTLDSTIRKRICRNTEIKYVELSGRKGTSGRKRKEHNADESQVGEKARPVESGAVRS